MLSKETIIEVTNRDNGTVGYYVQDLNIRRDFMPGETKEVTMEELRKLSFNPSGKSILNRCLVINNKEAVEEILGQVEPEYFYSEDEIKEILLSGSIDQFMDCLDFAPSGVIDLIKSLAVELGINDIQKREAILNKTGFNVTKAIEINRETKDENTVEEKQRRVAEPVTKENNDGKRRVEAPQYKVTSIQE